MDSNASPPDAPLAEKESDHLYDLHEPLCFTFGMFHLISTHTHYRKQRHENKHSRMQGEQTKVRNFPSEERKQSKNHCSPVKLESKKKW